ncbi:ABC transporter permease [Streptomyces chiangmaiensis]|uniref:ABC transporter permease n=1 Tax=Streptomyces chiangmaiensis TaxID=766497 RepID=A0ABU7FC87_9ACTN|nr:ABC transporter permease [Streptomyces chiangmaiensis]MED7821524.1 ABC transporter permease [Streptomyces chiangmaiensis]
MIVYLIRRLINVVVMLWVVSLVTFGIFFAVPKLTGTDPALMFAGRETNATAIEGIRHKMGFDKPIYVQYGQYMKGIVAGRDYDNGSDKTHCPAPCFGYSFKTEQPVWETLKEALPVTFSLAVGAAVLWVLGGVATGVISALRRRTVLDRVTMITALAGVSLPIYFTGLVASAVVVYSLGWMDSIDYVPIEQGPLEWAKNLLLPWITLAFLFAATYARLTRATMLEILGEDYIRTARAKGLKENVVIGKHALRATLTPIITIFGLDLGQLLGGAVLTEKTFNLRGLGYQAVTAIDGGDLPVIMGVTLFAALFIVVANLIVDLLYAVVDPRVRLT